MLVNTEHCIMWLTRGTVEAHLDTPFKLLPGNFSLVSDAPQMRYHDGVTPGGVVIHLDPELWAAIMSKYAVLRAKKVEVPPEKSLWHRFLASLHWGA